VNAQFPFGGWAFLLRIFLTSTCIVRINRYTNEPEGTRIGEIMAQSINKQSLKALNKAIKLLRSAPRWIKGNYQSTAMLKGRDIECYCVLGAIQKAADAHYPSQNEVISNLVDLTGKDKSVTSFLKRDGIPEATGGARITIYNDAQKRTYSQIMALLGRVKAKLEAKVNAEG
jgi:hypothetical protein